MVSKRAPASRKSRAAASPAKPAPARAKRKPAARLGTKAKAAARAKAAATPKAAARAAASAKAATKPAQDAAKRAPAIVQVMTRSPHTIGRDQTLARAHEVMNQHRIRHLPVLDGGQLVGILSQRDLYFVESLDGAAPAEVKVDEAMTQDVFEVTKDAQLADVVDTMLQEKHGCAVVTDAGRVIGVFSTVDALRVLLSYLR